MRCFFLLLIGLFSSPILAVQKQTLIKPWLRVDGEIAHMLIGPKGEFIAFTARDGSQLRILETATKKVSLISPHTVGTSLFWAPDGVRLFYRELYRNPKTSGVSSEIKAYDLSKGSNVSIEKTANITGLLNFDPRDLKLYYLSEKGLHTKQLVFPDQRLARWQIAQRTELGKWAATQRGILWVTDGGFSIRRMEDDHSPVQSFHISPDGSAVSWSTEAGHVYYAVNGQPPLMVGDGQDPRWHPSKPYLVYSAARRVGDTIRDYDIRLVSLTGAGKYLTLTQASAERWPNWHPDGKSLIFTRDGTTDLFKLEFEERL